MKKVEVDPPVSQLKPLGVKCSDTRCTEGFHYFTSDIKEKAGICKACDDKSVDWKRLHKHNFNDVEYTVESLSKELLRYVCWNNAIDIKAIIKAKERGRFKLREDAKNILIKNVSNPPAGYWDNLKTKKDGDEIVHYAQHATATCCRKCMRRWHNIPLNAILNIEQINYFLKLIEYYINKRVPELSDEGSTTKDK